MGSARRVRVLLVDDDPNFREALQAIFSFDERVEVVGQAGDGADAIRLTEELRPDVIAMDILMPGVNGLEATKAIRSRSTDCRVVLVSGSIFQEGAEQGVEVAREVGASGYVPKSRAVLELADAVVSAAGAPAPARFVSPDQRAAQAVPFGVPGSE